MTILPPTLAGQGHPAAGQTSRRPIVIAIVVTALLGLILFALVANIALIARARADAGPSIVVAIADIAPGVPIQADHVALAPWTAADIELEGEFSDINLVVGRVSSIPLRAGDPITLAKLADTYSTGERSFVPTVPPQTWAYKIPLGWMFGSPPPVTVGDRVDIFVYQQLPQCERPQLVLMIPGLKVIGVDDGALIFTVRQAEASLLTQAHQMNLPMLILLPAIDRPSASDACQ